ncbi:hypothetical protein [Desulfuromonas sp.]|uniref:hypothetical protein n=1 Tax=Desulfuromonas sp. TaxID=892 RepID=UPI0025B905A8|nr:hypothetical protein [Desulfuromonas sp.]
MELWIDYECPRCNITIQRNLRELAPEQNRQCPECNVRAVLTEEGLRGLERSLRDLPAS